MDIESRTCLSCGKPLKGRSDKKFCDDYCRNNYNNSLKSNNSKIIRNINNALRKNHHILENMIPENEETFKITRERLINAGFNFKYITHQYQTQKGHTYFYCYDLGYLPLDNNWFLLVRKREDRSL
ncbi:MAG: hypothetical protein ACK5NK_11500 [Niabella sp.]